MKLAQALAHHSNRLKDAAGLPVLEGLFGDAPLLLKNPIYYGLRASSLRLGYKYSSQADQSYFVWPLMFLDETLKSQVLPYRTNEVGIGAAETSAPGILTLQDVDLLPPQKNYLLHEVAHAVFHGIAADELTGLAKVLLAEACANAVEMLASSYQDSEEDLFYFSMNSYVRSDASTRELMIRFRTEFNDKNALKILCVLYYFSLHFVPLLSNEVFERLLSNLRTKFVRTGSSLKILQDVWGLACKLNLTFRTVTTRIYLERLGFEKPLEAIKSRSTLANLLDETRVAHPLLERFCDHVYGTSDSRKKSEEIAQSI